VKDYDIYFRLSIGGEQVPISSFSYSEDPASVGKKLTANLTDLETEIADDDEVIFEIGISVGGSVEWVEIFNDSKVNSESDVVRWLGDDKNFGALSRMAELWDITPEVPTVLYEPGMIDPVTQAGLTPGELVDEDLNPIEPLFIAKTNFTLYDLMNYVYVDKLGFDSIITNIENFRLNSATFGLSQTFHSVVASEIGVFEPKYSENNNVLWIIDPQGEMPPEMPVRSLPTRGYLEFVRDKQQGRKINCVILELVETTVIGSGDPTIKSKLTITEAGTFGSVGWQRNSVTEIWNEYPDGRVVPLRKETVVSALADGLTRTVSREVQEDHYKYNFQLKTGYTKTLSLYCILPGDSAKMRLVNTEENQIEWLALASPGIFSKNSETTTITGLVLEITTDEGAVRTSVYQANKVGEIPVDPSDDLEVVTRPISTRIDLFSDTGRDQIEVRRQRINYLNDDAPPDQNDTANHTGTIKVRASGLQSRTRRVVLLGPNPTPRRSPYTLRAGNVPYDVARSLAQRILDRQGQGPQSVNIKLSGLDLALTRGTLRWVVDRRTEKSYLVFITGVSIDGSNLGQPNFEVSMKATGIVIDEQE
jgi:hypothetical protein